MAVVICPAPGRAVGFALLMHEHDVAVVHRIQLQMGRPSTPVTDNNRSRSTQTSSTSESTAQ